MNFPTTQWTQLADASLNGDEAGREALSYMCEKYRRPVMAYLESRGMRREDLEDVTQDFFLKLIKSQVWKRADQAKGRFRTFLLTILNHLMRHQWRAKRTVKRGGAAVEESLDELTDSGLEFAADQISNMEVFDREWALTLVSDTICTVEAEFVQRDQKREFEILRRFLPGQLQPPSYEAAATDLGQSLTALKASVHRLRQRFREVLRVSVARTVSAPHEVDLELRYLGALLSGVQIRQQPQDKNGKSLME